MIIQTNYGDINKSDALEQQVHEQVNKALQHFPDQVTRVEVHLRDDKGRRQGQDDKRCTMEVRLTGRQPLAVEHRGGDIYTVIAETAEKMHSAVRKIVEKRKDRKV